MGLAATNNLHDRTGLEIGHPTRVVTVEPGVGSIIDDPKACLEPGAIGLLSTKNDYLSADLDEVSNRVDNEETG
jgi:hypothetical protein